MSQCPPNPALSVPAAASSSSSHLPSLPLSKIRSLESWEQQQSDRLHAARLDTTLSFVQQMYGVSCSGCKLVASPKSEGVHAGEFRLVACVSNRMANHLGVCEHCCFRSLLQWIRDLKNDYKFICSVVLPSWRTGVDAVYVKTESNRKSRTLKNPGKLNPLLTDRHHKGHALRELIEFLISFGLSVVTPSEEKTVHFLQTAIDSGCPASLEALSIKPFDGRTVSSTTMLETPGDLMKAIYELCLPLATSKKVLDFNEPAKPVYLVQLLNWIQKSTHTEQVWSVLRSNLSWVNQLFLRSGISLPSKLRVDSFYEYVRCIFQFNQELDKQLRSLLFPENTNMPCTPDSQQSVVTSSPSSPPMSEISTSETSTLPCTPLTAETLPLGEEFESPDTPMAFLGDDFDDVEASFYVGSIPLLGLSSSMHEVDSTEMERDNVSAAALLPAAAQSSSFNHSASQVTSSSASRVLPSTSASSRKRARVDTTRDQSEEELHQDKKYKLSSEDEEIPALPVASSPQFALPSHEWPFSSDSVSSSSSSYLVDPTPYSPLLSSPESSDMNDSEFGFP